MSEMRTRFRAQVVDEIKAVATEQLAAGGAEAVSLSAIAKRLGVSAPALYRYVSSRGALLEGLAADAYRDLGRAVAGARSPATFARRYRTWALAEPHRYRLLYVAPAPDGGEALAEATVQAAHAIMLALVDTLEPTAARPSRALRAELERWARARGRELDPAVGLRAIGVWARLHGHVGLEIEGSFASMGLDPDLLFDALVADLGGRSKAKARA